MDGRNSRVVLVRSAGKVAGASSGRVRLSRTLPLRQATFGVIDRCNFLGTSTHETLILPLLLLLQPRPSLAPTWNPSPKPCASPGLVARAISISTIQPIFHHGRPPAARPSVRCFASLADCPITTLTASPGATTASAATTTTATPPGTAGCAGSCWVSSSLPSFCSSSQSRKQLSSHIHHAHATARLTPDLAASPRAAEERWVTSPTAAPAGRSAARHSATASRNTTHNSPITPTTSSSSNSRPLTTTATSPPRHQPTSPLVATRDTTRRNRRPTCSSHRPCTAAKDSNRPGTRHLPARHRRDIDRDGKGRDFSNFYEETAQRIWEVQLLF
nr:hypothetical protein CFP56_09626 [Quercus suber]